MPPPANQTSGTAIDLGSLPWTVSQNVHDAGTTYDVWYKYTATQNGLVYVFPFGGTVNVGYQPRVEVYGPNSAVTFILTGIPNSPIQVYLQSGSEYFFKFLTNNVTVTPAQLAIVGQLLTEESILVGDIFISDDTPGFPGIILSGTTAQPKKSFQPFPSAEAAAILTDGIFIIEDKDDSIPKIYSATLALLYSVAGLINYSLFVGNRTNTFYCCLTDNGVGGAFIKKVTSAGVVSGLIATLPHSNIGAIAISPDETILYYHVQAGLGFNIIYRHNLVTDTPMTDLAGAQAGYNLIGAREILCLIDGTVLKTYISTPPVYSDYMIRRYSAVGAILNTYGPFAETVGTIQRMAYAIDDPNSFWVWYEQVVSAVSNVPTGRSIFKNVRISDGTQLANLTGGFQYEVGSWVGVQTATPVVFGHSESCPFIILRTATPPGIFVIVTDRRYDTDGTQGVAIPTPTFKTALMP